MFTHYKLSNLERIFGSVGIILITFTMFIGYKFYTSGYYHRVAVYNFPTKGNVCNSVKATVNKLDIGTKVYKYNFILNKTSQDFDFDEFYLLSRYHPSGYIINNKDTKIYYYVTDVRYKFSNLHIENEGLTEFTEVLVADFCNGIYKADSVDVLNQMYREKIFSKYPNGTESSKIMFDRYLKKRRPEDYELLKQADEYKKAGDFEKFNEVLKKIKNN